MWRSPHETRRTAAPTAAARAALRISPGGHERLDLAVARRALGRLRPRRLRSQEGDRDEWEEPRDVEIEPVREHELEADEERRRQSREPDRRPRPRDEGERESREHEHDLERPLDEREVDVAVLSPVPDRERRSPREL